MPAVLRSAPAVPLPSSMAAKYLPVPTHPATLARSRSVPVLSVSEARTVRGAASSAMQTMTLPSPVKPAMPAASRSRQAVRFPSSMVAKYLPVPFPLAMLARSRSALALSPLMGKGVFGQASPALRSAPLTTPVKQVMLAVSTSRPAVRFPSSMAQYPPVPVPPATRARSRSAPTVSPWTD